MKTRTYAYVLLISLIASCASSKNVENDPTVIPDQILVDLSEGTSPETFQEEYSKYGLTFLKTVSPSSNIVLYRFDDSKIGVQQLVKKIAKDGKVDAVQTNKKTSNRRT